MIKDSFKTGLSFGTTSGIITTLGLIVGLHSGTHSKLVLIGGVLTIAIADAFSDALGIHISEESESIHTGREVWESTISTFFSKLAFALTFIFPIFLLDLSVAIIVSVFWGLCVLSILSFSIAKEQKVNPWKAVIEHLIVAFLVVGVTHYVGEWIGTTFD